MCIREQRHGGRTVKKVANDPSVASLMYNYVAAHTRT